MQLDGFGEIPAGLRRAGREADSAAGCIDHQTFRSSSGH